MPEMKTDRRDFLVKTGPFVAAAFVGAAALGTAVDAVAEEHQHGMMMGPVGSDGYTMSTAVKACGTCEAWGGPRRVSKDGKNITFTGLGWCNNAKCPGYQGMSSPDHPCQQGACWRKWSVLG